MERFAREDKKIRGHLDVIRRKELLEVVLGKMESLRMLEGGQKKGVREGVGVVGKGVGKGNERKRGWSMF